MANSIIRGVDRLSRRSGRRRLGCGDGAVGQVDVSLFRGRLLTYVALRLFATAVNGLRSLTNMLMMG